MKRHLELILNKVLKEQKDLLYGNDSKIVVDRLDWSDNKKSFLINITIFTSNIEESVEAHPDGINYLVDCGWPILGRRGKKIVISSLDVN
jgi:hypothetical protein